MHSIPNLDATLNFHLTPAFTRSPTQDGSKTLSVDECLEILKTTLGSRMSDTDARTFVGKFDADGNGELDINEFRTAYQELRERLQGAPWDRT